MKTHPRQTTIPPPGLEPRGGRKPTASRPRGTMPHTHHLHSQARDKTKPNLLADRASNARTGGTRVGRQNLPPPPGPNTSREPGPTDGTATAAQKRRATPTGQSPFRQRSLPSPRSGGGASPQQQETGGGTHPPHNPHPPGFTRRRTASLVSGTEPPVETNISGGETWFLPRPPPDLC